MAFLNFRKPKIELEKGGRAAAEVQEDASEPEKTCPNCRAKKREITTITCVDCGKEFTMTGREIEYFTKREMQIPKRCTECREYKKHRNENKG